MSLAEYAYGKNGPSGVERDAAKEFPDSKYLSFELDDHYDGKTERVTIVAKKHLEILGEIKWFGRWRQYAFFPEPHTVWNKECLDDVQACIEALKLRRTDRQREQEERDAMYGDRPRHSVNAPQ